MKKHVVGLMSAAALAVCALSAPAMATTQTISLDTVFAGTTPSGPAPWLTATFDYQEGSKTGILTLTSNIIDGNFLQGGTGKITGWNFFLNDGFSLSDLTCTSGTCADSTRETSKAIGPSAAGSYNLGFGWSSGNRFDGSDVATYKLTFGDVLNSNPFGANGNGWWSIAHVQGITVSTAGCDTSGWIVSGTNGQGAAGSGVCVGTPPPPTDVPEPGALGMFGLGVLLIGGFIGWRRRYA